MGIYKVNCILKGAVLDSDRVININIQYILDNISIAYIDYALEKSGGDLLNSLLFSPVIITINGIEMLEGICTGVQTKTDANSKVVRITVSSILYRLVQLSTYILGLHTFTDTTSTSISSLNSTIANVVENNKNNPIDVIFKSCFQSIIKYVTSNMTNATDKTSISQAATSFYTLYNGTNGEALNDLFDNVLDFSECTATFLNVEEIQNIFQNTLSSPGRSMWDLLIYIMREYSLCLCTGKGNVYKIKPLKPFSTDIITIDQTDIKSISINPFPSQMITRLNVHTSGQQKGNIQSVVRSSAWFPNQNTLTKLETMFHTMRLQSMPLPSVVNSKINNTLISDEELKKYAEAYFYQEVLKHRYAELETRLRVDSKELVGSVIKFKDPTFGTEFQGLVTKIVHDCLGGYTHYLLSYVVSTWEKENIFSTEIFPTNPLYT